MATKPTILKPKWAEEDVTDSSGRINVQEPPDAEKDAGWAKGDFMPRQWVNWLARSAYRWLAWAETSIDELIAALAAEVSARTTAVTNETNARIADVNDARARLLEMANDVIDGGAGLTPYANLDQAATDSWSRLIQAVLFQQDFAVEFRNSANSVIGTGTVTLYTTMGGMKVLALPPLNASDPEVVRIYGPSGSALPAELFPWTPSTPVGGAVVVFSTPFAIIANGGNALWMAEFIYSSTGAFPLRQIGISIPGSAGASNGWRATSITFPAIVANPLGP